jgi:uncharacterized protein (TIGR02271 family)
MNQDLKGHLRRGMAVVGVDNTEHGTIERFNDTHIYVRGRPIPYDAFEGVNDGRLHLGRRGTSYVANHPDPLALNAEAAMRLPVIEEQVHVEKRLVDRGYIEIRKTVVTEQVMIPVELRREVIEVRRVDTQEARESIIDTPGAPSPFEPDVIRIPVLRETAVIQKNVVVTSEIVVERTSVSEHQEIPVTVRRERVSVTRDDQPQTVDPGHRAASGPTTSAARSIAPTAPTFDKNPLHDT